MLERFKKYILDKDLFNTDDKVLLAVSGGVDSVVMLHLFVASGYKCGVAHCNFSLRGEASDSDQEFVKQLAKSYDVDFHTITFDTKEYSKKNGVSTQMAARELRYDWFDKIKLENGYDYIATAHNKNDVVETFLINLTRGTGIKGLTGIKAKINGVIRPTLFATRTDITDYLMKHKLEYHEDVTNAEVKYTRNKIRHKVIPVLKEINPGILETFEDNIERLDQVEEIYRSSINEKRSKVVREDGDVIYFSIAELLKLNSLKSYLYEFLLPYNFSSDSIEDVISIIDNESGKQVLSSTHRILKDRDNLIITSVEKELNISYLIERRVEEIEAPLNVEISEFHRADEFIIPKEANRVCFDVEKLVFPLKIRKWNEGDKFMPLGMKGMKKLSDFFIDIKLSLVDKENIWLLTSGDDIIWVMGKRIDDRYKITKETKRIIQLEIK